MPSYSLPARQGGFLSGSGLPSLETGLTVRKEVEQEVHTKLPDRLLRAYEQIKQGVFISESKLWPGRRCLRLSQGVNAGEVLFYGGLPDESSGWSGRRPSMPDSGEDFKFIWRQEFTRAKEDRVTQRRYLVGNAERCLWPHLLLPLHGLPGANVEARVDFTAGAHGESLAFIAKAPIPAFVEELVLDCRFEPFTNSSDEHGVAKGQKRKRGDIAMESEQGADGAPEKRTAAGLDQQTEEMQLTALQTGVTIRLHDSFCDLHASGDPIELQKHTLLWRSTGGRVSRNPFGPGLQFDVSEDSLLCLLGDDGHCSVRDAATTCAEIAKQRSVDIAGVLLDHVCEGDVNKITKVRHRDEAARHFFFPPEEGMLQSAKEGTCYIKAHGENFGKRLATLEFQVEWCKRKNVIVPVGFGLVVVVDVVEVAAGGVRVFGRPQDVRGDLVD